MQKAILFALLLATVAVSKSVDSFVVSSSEFNIEHSLLTVSELTNVYQSIFGSVLSKRPSESSIEFIR